MCSARTAAFFLVFACTAFCQSSRPFDVTGEKLWTDTGIEVKAGDMLRITSTGQLQYVGAEPCGPGGLQRGWTDLIRQLPINSEGRGTLVGRIGDTASAIAFLVGPQI